jgi:hypothetical protein
MIRPLVYLWAFPTTLLGLTVALLTLLTRGRAHRVDGVLEVHGGFATFFLNRLTPIHAAAMTLGHVVIGQNQACLDATRRHERVHVRQCERWGPLFVPAYFLASLYVWLRGRKAYRDNPFEREAYDKGR